jgi:catechol 2,3-dioxygenase-like lactoylglutathione lyase family enzyme
LATGEINHVDLTVSSLERSLPFYTGDSAVPRLQVDRLYELLKEMDARILDPPAVYYQPDYYAVFFADPDGIKLELCHRPGRR